MSNYKINIISKKICVYVDLHYYPQPSADARLLA